MSLKGLKGSLKLDTETNEGGFSTRYGYSVNLSQGAQKGLSLVLPQPGPTDSRPIVLSPSASVTVTVWTLQGPPKRPRDT